MYNPEKIKKFYYSYGMRERERVKAYCLYTVLDFGEFLLAKGVKE